MWTSSMLRCVHQDGASQAWCRDMSEGGFAEDGGHPLKHWCCCWPCLNPLGTTPSPLAEVVNELPWPHDGVRRQMAQSITALHGPCFLQLFSFPISRLCSDFLGYFFLLALPNELLNGFDTSKPWQMAPHVAANVLETTDGCCLLPEPSTQRRGSFTGVGYVSMGLCLFPLFMSCDRMRERIKKSIISTVHYITFSSWKTL